MKKSTQFLFCIVLLAMSDPAFAQDSARQNTNFFTDFISATKEFFMTAFNFDEKETREPSKDSDAKAIMIDFAMEPFEKTKEGQEYFQKHHSWPELQDYWGYPMAGKFYSKYDSKQKGSGLLKSILWSEAFASDEGALPGQVNCRPNTSETGYFKAYFEDVALDNGVGYDDPTFGQARRDAACEVLQEIATLIKLDQTQLTPDIIFAVPPSSIPPNALAAASAYYPYNGPPVLHNGTLHKHIVEHQDPTPAVGQFDAVIYTNFSFQWSVDSQLSPNTYDYATVMRHEVLHAMGFMSRLPAVISNSGQEARRNSFDENLYRGDSTDNADRYFDFTQIFSPLLQVPNGSPSAWFINNQSTYNGKINVPGATFSGSRPLYSPTSWQQGSSISHFDMNQAPPGTSYNMHPSLGQGVSRSIHLHEKETLCHLGYQVAGLQDCELPTPVANDDVIAFNGTYSGVQCLNVAQSILQNDISFSGGQLSIADTEVMISGGGASAQFYDTLDCTGSVNPTGNGAQSIRYSSLSNSTIGIKYRVLDSVTNRISFPANITISNFQCSQDPNEYVCNGDFELGPASPVTFCFACTGDLNYAFGNTYGQVPFWGNANTSNHAASIISQNNPLQYPHLAAFPFMVYGLTLQFDGVDSPGITLNLQNGSSWAAGMREFRNYPGAEDAEGQSMPSKQRIATRLRMPLVAGEVYRIQFDVASHKPPSNWWAGDYPLDSRNFQVKMSTQSLFAPDWSQESPNFAGAAVIVDQSAPITALPLQSLIWTHIDQTFTASEALEYLAIYNPEFPIQSDSVVYNIVDNVSIKRVPSNNLISGTVFNDLNSNGVQNPGDLGLGGVTVGLFDSPTATAPIMTTTTGTDFQDLGQYRFEQIPNLAGTGYRVALMNEGDYQSISMPPQNNSLAGYQHSILIPFSSGGIADDKNFGIMLNNQTAPVPDLAIGDISWITGNTQTGSYVGNAFIDNGLIYGFFNGNSTFNNGPLYSVWDTAIVTVRARIKNNGTASVVLNSSNFATKLVVSSSQYGQNEQPAAWLQASQLQYYHLSSLAYSNPIGPLIFGDVLVPDASKYLYLFLKINKTAIPYLNNAGPHTLQLFIDSANQIQESNENNNASPVININVSM